MIIKNKDNKQDSIDYLSDLLDRDISMAKKSLIAREIDNLSSFNITEASPEYYLNAEFGATKNWLLMHDLRIEHNGEVAQIDHLLIGRMMDVYVIDSKNFNFGISISETGDFSYAYKDEFYSIDSPILHNQRAIESLNKFLTDSELLPKRLGVVLKPVYRNIVLCSPDSVISKPKKGFYDCSAVMKVNKFLERFSSNTDKALEDVANLAKVISQDSLQRFSEKIVLQHKPFKADYANEFFIKHEAENTVAVSNEKLHLPACPVCGKEMVKREAKKGKNVGKVFYGCSQFPKCRGVLEPEESEVDEKISIATQKVSESNNIQSPACPKCNGGMVKRISINGEKAGREFWGCENFPKCRGAVSIK